MVKQFEKFLNYLKFFLGLKIMISSYLKLRRDKLQKGLKICFLIY